MAIYIAKKYIPMFTMDNLNIDKWQKVANYYDN